MKNSSAYLKVKSTIGQLLLLNSQEQRIGTIELPNKLWADGLNYIRSLKANTFEYLLELDKTY